MTEKPILFNGEMVRAILDGRKTQTRRIVKVQPATDRHQRITTTSSTAPLRDWAAKPCRWAIVDDKLRTSEESEPFSVPYQVGQRLWVRETWQPIQRRSANQDAQIKAWFAKEDKSNFMNEVEQWAPMPDGEMAALYAADFGDWAFDPDSDLKPWKSPIFMPRWASRITLEVVAVRVERLQDISYRDVIAEGLNVRVDGVKIDYRAVEAFYVLWDKINGKRAPWASNPWVWCVEFKKV